MKNFKIRKKFLNSKKTFHAKSNHQNFLENKFLMLNIFINQTHSEEIRKNFETLNQLQFECFIEQIGFQKEKHQFAHDL